MTEKGILQLKAKDNTIRKSQYKFAKANTQAINPHLLATFVEQIENGKTATVDDIKTLAGEIFRLRGRMTVLKSDLAKERQLTADLQARLRQKRPPLQF